MKEKELFMLTQKKITAVDIDPKKYSFIALRQILRYQIYNGDPTEIVIVQNGRHTISYENLKDARKYIGDKRKSFLDSMALRMKQAKIIIINRPPISSESSDKGSLDLSRVPK